MGILKNILHIIIILVLLVGWILFFCTKKPKIGKVFKNTCATFKKNWQSITWIAFYLVLLALSSYFVWKNWSKCLDMEFFSRFNGYNIIWILWIFLLFVPLISIDNKWFKMVGPLAKREMERQNIEEKAKTEQYATQFASLEIENTNKKEGK